jgi:LuxR family maltose regulon positive regulatory protein
VIERGRFAEGEHWLQRAAPIVAHAPEPALRVALCHGRGMLALARGRLDDALAAFTDGERKADELRVTHFLAVVERQWRLRMLLARGEHEAVRSALPDPEAGAQACSLAARLCLAEDDAEGAVAALVPALNRNAPVRSPNVLIEARLLDALARTRLGDAAAAERSVEAALALAEPDGRVWIVLTIPGARELLEAHPRHRTAHAGHLSVLLDLLAGVEPPLAAPDPLAEPLSDRELAVLRFLPTNLSAGDIGSELFLSVHTVKTHMRKLYAKLDVHTRAEAVQRGRALGLLAPARRGG